MRCAADDRAEVPTEGGGKFDPSRRGGHKNLENAATFSKLLGQEDKLSPAPRPNRQQPTSNAGAVLCRGLGFRNIKGAAGKRYERGLTCAAGHGVPGVLLPSQPRSGNVALRGRFMARGSQPVKDMRGTRYLGRAERRIYAD